jgi:NAD+ kinase
VKVGLLLKRNKPEAVELARELCPALVDLGAEPMVAGADDEIAAGRIPHARAVPESRLVETRLLAVLGGDGTLLRGAGVVADHGVPILGINLGNLGFLTICPPEEGRATLEKALAGALPLERRLRLRVELERQSGERIERFACNDAVISQGGVARLIEFETFLDDLPVARYRADGLIIATPTGSTAYNLAAGGPILGPALEAMVLSPICPHALTNRPLVVPSDSRLMVRMGAAAQHVVLTVDGQWAIDLDQKDRVCVHAAHNPMLLFRSDETTYFDILRAKLHWGENVGHPDATPGPIRR